MRNRVTLLRMRMLSTVAMTGLLVLAGCSGGAGDEAAFEGDPIEGGAATTSVPPATTEPDADDGAPERITLDPEALLEELLTDTTLPEEPPPVTAGDVGGDSVDSFRAALDQSGLSDDQIDCLVTSASDTLSMSEAEIDQLTADDPANGWLVMAGQAAVAECLPASVPSGGSDEGVTLPVQGATTLSEQLAGLGLTPAETDCITTLYTDQTTAAENKDFLACIPLSRLVELAG